MVLVVAGYPRAAVGQATLSEDGLLSNGCSWDDLNFELVCSELGLERLPYVHPNISSVTQKL